MGQRQSPSETSEIGLDALAEELRQDGLCTFRNLFSSELVTRWRVAFEALVEERRSLPGGLAPRGPGRFYLTLPWREPFCDPEVFANPAILGVLNRVFPQEYVMVQLAVDTPVRGSDFQALHRDFRPLFTETTPTPLYALALNFPLVPVAEENGPLEVVRGSHRVPRDEAMRLVESGATPLEAVHLAVGDVTLRTPFALHRGTPNRTDIARPMIVLGYVMHWLHTPKVDLTVPRAAYDRLPPEQQRLLRCEIVDELPRGRGESYVEFAY